MKPRIFSLNSKTPNAKNNELKKNKTQITLSAQKAGANVLIKQSKYQ